MIRIDQMTREEKAQFQRMLIREKYLPLHNAKGRPNDDGIWGTVSAAAYAQYLEDQIAESSDFIGQIITPPAAKPWWQSRRGMGLIKILAGAALSVLGMFWTPAENINSALLLDTIFNTLPSILEALGMGVALYGTGQAAVGAAQAQAPLTLRAPRPASGLQPDKVPTNTNRAARSRRSAIDKALGNFSDDS